MTTLDIAGLSRSFGGVHAVRDVDLHVGDGETRGIIGPNGAGKSTLFNLISGHLRPDRGTVALAGRPLGRMPAHARARRGVAIVFQNARIFPGMTVRENVMVGAHLRARAGFASAILRLPAHHAAERHIHALASESLERVGLAERAEDPAESLPIGQQRAMQLARALCADPKVLLLDEPASGLRAQERERLARTVEQLRDGGRTMLLIEHDVSFVARLSDRVTVLDLGQVIAEGTPAEVRRDPQVVAAYLGPGKEEAS